jgi:heme iron utilization protein
MKPPSTSPADGTAVHDAAVLVREARTAALATLDAATGHPYVSFVTIAVDATGQPIVLISQLARHTRNLSADPRASVLFEPRDRPPGDPLANGRVTMIGRMMPTQSATAQACFLARHPDAEMYAAFADFGFYALTSTTAHFIGGFGRIIEIPGADLTQTLAHVHPG